MRRVLRASSRARGPPGLGPKMRSRGAPSGPRRRGSAALLLAASARLYSALLVFYPKAFRQRYVAEMRRDFFELLWEGLQEGGSNTVPVC